LIYPLALKYSTNVEGPIDAIKYFLVKRCGFTLREDGKSVCDTPYAVFEGKKEAMTITQVVKHIEAFNCKHIVFTGGEPLLYQKQMHEILSTLGEEYFVEVETNGTIAPDALIWNRINQFNISVKLKSSNQWKGYDEKRINFEVLKIFPTDRSIFKFVCGSEEDKFEIQIISKHIPDILVYLMPMGDTREKVLKSLPITMELCLKNGWGFTNRDHILAYDDKRGV